MPAVNPQADTLFLLDFDGVVCDSAIETAVTGWRAAQQFWDDISGDMPPAALIDGFRQVRPALETGFESILIMRALYDGVSAHALLENFSAEMKIITVCNTLDSADLKAEFARVRDHWIANDLTEWVQMNPLFEGVANRLRQLNNGPQPWYIITTKQERFVTEILNANNVPFPPERIYGLDRGQSKIETLTELKATHPDAGLLFIEDRLPTLTGIRKVAALDAVTLYLADWGYNSEQDLAHIVGQPISQLSLAQFTG